jgi:SAM-dependent methyltransferase
LNTITFLSAINAARCLLLKLSVFIHLYLLYPNQSSTMDPQLHSVEVYNQHVKEYVAKFNELDLYNDTFDDLMALLSLNSKILELGSGPGNVARYFLDKRKDFKIEGKDLAPEMVNFANKYVPEASFEVMDVREAHRITEKYNAVICAFCLPYLSPSDLENLTAALSNLVLENGYVYLSCMEGQPEKSGFEKTSFTGNHELYIYYYQRSALEQAFAKVGFSIEKFYTKDYPETDGSFTTDLIYIFKRF